MKIKSDFITNSSSTNYIMLFKGKNRRSLYKAIKDSEIMLYEEIESDITETGPIIETISCNEKDLIKSLINHRRKIKIKSIDEIIENLKYHLNEWDEIINDSGASYLKSYIESYSRLKTVEKAKEFGFEKGIEVEYGDGGGCGIEEGTNLSKLMEWEKLEFFSDDLIIINESRH